MGLAFVYLREALIGGEKPNHHFVTVFVTLIFNMNFYYADMMLILRITTNPHIGKHIMSC